METKIQTTPRVQNAIRNALAWLKDNPTRHISGRLAVKENGDYCEPLDPGATCFCVLGRISKELGVDGYPENDLEYRQTIEDHLSDLSIYSKNDIYDGNGPRPRAVCGDRYRGNPEVFDFLNEKIDLGMPEGPTLGQRIHSFLFGE